MSFEGRSWADISDDDDDDYETMLVDYEDLEKNPVAPPRAPSPPTLPRTSSPPPLPSPKPTRVKRASFPENALAALLQQAKTMCESHKDTVELEFRLGRCSGSHFDSGIPRATFEGIMALCRKLATQPPHETHDTSILFSPGLATQTTAPTQYRATIDAKTKRIKEVCEKIRHRNLNVASAPFDIRLSLATENRVDHSLTERPKGYTRHKQRWSFELPLLTGCRILQLPSEQHVQYAYDTLFATFFDGSFLSPAFLDVPLAEPTMRPETWHATMRSELFATLKRKSNGNGQYRYPGSLPITFLRHYFPQLNASKQSYAVAEKTDGERYLMFARPGQPLLLVNRSTDFLPVRTTKRTTFLHPIVLDGEMVRDARSFAPVFLVFDVLALKDDALLELPFRERQRHLANMRFDTLHAPFKVAQKHYHPLSKLKSDVFQCIRRHPLTKERLFYDNANQLVYRTDGVIFQPNRPYRMGTDYSFFKYKYADELTVEFALRYALRGGQCDRQRYQLCLTQRGSRQFHVYRTYALRNVAPDERTRLTRLLDSGTSHTLAIGEFCYDAKIGRWVLVAPRYDKRRPNVVDILLDTLELLTQKLTPKQLVEALQ
jgi:hypothetical protein